MPRPGSYIDHRGRKCKISWRRLRGSGHRYVEGGDITISTTRDETWQASTLLHELLHASAASYLLMDNPEAGLEEALVGALERNLVSIWQRNPAVFEWIHRTLTKEGGKGGER